jgi:exodeoxyribonuclease V beta subunit
VSAPVAPESFDLRGALPRGVAVLEASAGTGKTFAITALAVRYIAEGRRPDQLLVVTFTIAATAELRDRLRGELVRARDGLDAHLKGVGVPPDDDLLMTLVDAADHEIRNRHGRLVRAVANFDAVTIATTHSFCQQVLRSLGVAGDVEEDAALLGDLGSLVDETVDDIYVRDYAPGAHAPLFDHATARAIGRAVVSRNTFAELLPVPDPPTTLAHFRVLFAADVRAEVERRKRRMGALTFDDLQGRLRDVLVDPVRGARVAAHLAERFSVVLIDEFQDTDPVQYDIVREAFATGRTTLVLIGDPKQAIYGFRGADVEAYLRAAAHATERKTMDVSWRSDARLLQALDAVFDHARLGSEEIEYRRLRPAPGVGRHDPKGLPVGEPMRIRVVAREDHPGRGLLAAEARERVARDLGADVVGLLSANAALQPGDVAVLVRKGSHGVLIRNALRSVGVPAVISGGGSVYATPMADDWLRLLEGLERPSARARATAAVLSVFFGWDAERVATAADVEWETVHERLANWALLLARHGVAALLAAISRSEDLPARMLSRADGEREFTDLRHIGQLLHAAATAHDLRASGLVTWLSEEMGSAELETDSDERARRLDSDAAAVQVLTIHGAKGLEFPIVYCPYLWEEGWIPEPGMPQATPVFHADDGSGRRLIEVGGKDAAGFRAAWERSRDEQRGEELRLLYVALTRARHQVVMWWAPTRGAFDSPLGRLVLSRAANGTIPPVGLGVIPDADIKAAFERLAQAAPGCIGVEPVLEPSPRRWAGPPARTDVLVVNTFDRELDARWRRTSYSGITHVAHQGFEQREAEVVLRTDDEPLAAPTEVEAREISTTSDLSRVALPLATMPASAQVGTIIHKVMEEADFAAADLPTEIATLLAREVGRHRIELGDLAEISRALASALASPLGPALGEFCLAGAAMRDRVDEMAFEIPLSGGDDPTGDLVVGEIARLLHAYLPAADPLHAYADRLAGSGFAGTALRGYLNGFLDLVVRIPGVGGTDPQFAVIDYKTNRLGGRGVVPTAWDYRPEAVTAAMYASDYPLQALLYLVALHRYLRWRMPDSSPERHIAGAAYLFVRGMVGPDTPRVDGAPCGVWSWNPPTGLVVALSDLLDEGAA